MREGFIRTYGSAPEGIWRAPGRVNLMGEHTDYNLGFVLPFAIDKNALVAVRRRTANEASPRLLEFASTYGGTTGPLPVTGIELDALAPGNVPGWAAYPAAVAYVLGQLPGVQLSGFELLVDSDVPVGSGLSSSHAIEVGTIVALNDLFGLELDATAMARLTQRAENGFVGAPTGIMDQSASLMSRAEHALFLDCRSLASHTVPLPLAAQDTAVLVIDTRVEHSHVDGGYAARRASCEQAAVALGVESLREITEVALLDRLEPELRRRARHIVTENQRVLDTVKALEASDLREVGRLLRASHVSMRDDYEISCPELDLAVQASLAAGAIGARMTGGGFGGSAIALIAVERIPAASASIRRAFAQAGYAEPSIFTVNAAEGAGRA
ncbi:galactokinase [Glutamicibacter sp. MNS18]|nr:galactokinase [Glutamicibacter sp. MNS18]MCW4466393.1 galactokinase [Glutamicibacter sp. MNS18]